MERNLEVPQDQPFLQIVSFTHTVVPSLPPPSPPSTDPAGVPADQQEEVSGHGGPDAAEGGGEAQQVCGGEPGEPEAEGL